MFQNKYHIKVVNSGNYKNDFAIYSGSRASITLSFRTFPPTEGLPIVRATFYNRTDKRSLAPHFCVTYTSEKVEANTASK